MLTTTHVSLFVTPTLTAANAAGFVTVSVTATGTTDALIIKILLMGEFEFLELTICALTLAPGVYYASMAVAAADPDGIIFFSGVVGDAIVLG